jgi:hypothetical protein
VYLVCVCASCIGGGEGRGGEKGNGRVRKKRGSGVSVTEQAKERVRSQIGAPMAIDTDALLFQVLFVPRQRDLPPPARPRPAPFSSHT